MDSESPTILNTSIHTEFVIAWQLNGSTLYRQVHVLTWHTAQLGDLCQLELNKCWLPVLSYLDPAFRTCGLTLSNKLPFQIRHKRTRLSHLKWGEKHTHSKSHRSCWNFLIFVVLFFIAIFVYFCWFMCVYNAFSTCVLLHTCIAHWGVWNCTWKNILI